MIDNINANQVGHLLGKSFPLNADAPASRPHNDADAALNVRFGDLINQARQSAADNSQAVHEARELLESGRLTSSQNIEAAARNMLSCGI
jgi:hypothetical protein